MREGSEGNSMGWAIRCRLLVAAGAMLLVFGMPTSGSAEGGGGSKDFYKSYGAVDARVPPAADLDAGVPAHGRSGVGEGTVLLINGVIGPGAHRQFQWALSRSVPTLIVLDSPGGVLGEALLIAEEVRRRGLNTLVAARSSCASACAIVFLAGRTKYLGAGGAIGLHMASYADGRADPEATELMAAYLRELGVPGSALRAMAATAPSDIRWLTTAERQAVGIRAYVE
jgi:hypothetical protein